VTVALVLVMVVDAFAVVFDFLEWRLLDLFESVVT
jgi:hypothetical protein